MTDLPADQVSGSDFYKRPMSAHANCVKNLPDFTALVFAVHVAGLNLASISYLPVIVVVARIARLTSQPSGKLQACSCCVAFAPVMFSCAALKWLLSGRAMHGLGRGMLVKAVVQS